MPTHIKIELNPDEQTIVFNGRKMGLKTSGLANNGLSLNPSTHKLVATKAPDGRPGSGGTMNLPGNGIGPTNASMTKRGRIQFISITKEKGSYRKQAIFNR